MITVNGWKPLTIITKRSILDVPAALSFAIERLLEMLPKTLYKNIKAPSTTNYYLDLPFILLLKESKHFRYYSRLNKQNRKDIN